MTKVRRECDPHARVALFCSLSRGRARTSWARRCRRSRRSRPGRPLGLLERALLRSPRALLAHAARAHGTGAEIKPPERTLCIIQGWSPLESRTSSMARAACRSADCGSAYVRSQLSSVWESVPERCEVRARSERVERGCGTCSATAPNEERSERGPCVDPRELRRARKLRGLHRRRRTARSYIVTVRSAAE